METSAGSRHVSRHGKAADKSKMGATPERGEEPRGTRRVGSVFHAVIGARPGLGFGFWERAQEMRRKRNIPGRRPKRPAVQPENELN